MNTCSRCGLTDAKVLDIDTGSACHPELMGCIEALRMELAGVALERTVAQASVRLVERENETLRAELAEMNALFALQHQRTLEADAEYVTAHPRPDCPHGYRPDLGELIRWLREERDRYRNSEKVVSP